MLKISSQVIINNTPQDVLSQYEVILIKSPCICCYGDSNTVPLHMFAVYFTVVILMKFDCICYYGDSYEISLYMLP